MYPKYLSYMLLILDIALFTMSGVLIAEIECTLISSDKCRFVKQLSTAVISFAFKSSKTFKYRISKWKRSEFLKRHGQFTFV